MIERKKEREREKKTKRERELNINKFSFRAVKEDQWGKGSGSDHDLFVDKKFVPLWMNDEKFHQIENSIRSQVNKTLLLKTLISPNLYHWLDSNKFSVITIILF